MLFTDKALQVGEFPVDKTYGEDESFFRLITPGGEVQLPKLLFQKDQPLPDTLSCRIKGYNGKVPVLGHNMPRYVSEFYADGFSKGQEFDFQVIFVSDAAKGYYRLADQYGLTFNLHEPKTLLSRGQTVKCKFDVLEANFFKLHRSSTDKQYQMINMGIVASKVAVKNYSSTKLEALLRKRVPEIADALDELNHGRPIWALTAMRALKQAMPRLFSEAIAEEEPDKILDAIKGYERVLLYMLQGSGFLRNIRGTERTQLQAEITANIEQLDIYRRTLYIVANQEERKFINDLLNNLKESGYIYHPTTQFSIMMILFRMNPELVNSSLGNIFDTLMGWELDTWKNEPFRQAFVEQLEIYISETRREIDNFLQAETAADNEKIERVLTAIAIQQSLATESDSADIRLNKSLFYRYLSVLRNAKAGVLLEKSYLTLMGVNLPTDYLWSDIKETTMMMTRAAVDPPMTATLPSNPKYYFYDNIDVEVGPEGITIDKVNDDAVNVVPNGMIPWLGLKVNANIKSPSRQKIKTMEGHAEFWSNIENALFMPDEVQTDMTSQTKRIPDIDDTVRMEVIRVILNANDSNRIEGFECMVRDDHFVECKAILPAHKIVNYTLHGVTVGTFRHDDGTPMLFDAIVDDIDDNDTLILSLSDLTRQASRDMASVGEKCFCVITNDNGRSYSAISEYGFSLFVNKTDPSMPPFHKGNVLKVEITGFNYDAIQSVVDEGPFDNFFFSNARAVHNLLEEIAVVREDLKTDDLQYDEDDIMPAEDMREIIELLRFKAISENDIITAFDYLSYARLLALVIEDFALADVIRAHKEILLLHQHYAKNKSLFIEDISRILDESPENTFIERMATRLRIVASLDNPVDNDVLWNIVNDPNSIDSDAEIAQMVLSYNLLTDMDHEDATAVAIKDKIAKKLNVTSEQRELKYYGTESQYVEFKSSLVYPAVKGKAGLSMADPAKQEYEILHIIAGFLNSTGGTLYIGVNDGDHYERGLEEDFKFYKLDQSEKNNKYRRGVKSLDNMANYLQHLIDDSFNLGKNAGDYAKTYIDEESVKGVVAVKIDPCPHVVYFDNQIFVRHGAKTEPLLRKDEMDRFISDRKQLYSQLAASAAKAAKAAGTIEVASQATSDIAKAPKEAPADAAQQQNDVPQPVSVYEQITPANQFSISTSDIRKNVLHDFEDPDHFVPPYMYIRFVNDNDYIITTDEWSIDMEKDRLALAITEEEAQGYLLLVYEGECAIKVKISELLEKSQNTPLAHYPNLKLMFAVPVSGDDGLYSMHSNNKSTLYERVTPVDRIQQGSMNTAPERIMEGPSVITVFYEKVSTSKMHELEQILSTGMKRNQIGSLVKGVSSIKASVEEARKLVMERLR